MTFEFLKDDVYSLRKEGDGLRVTKFTKDLNPVGFYHLKPTAEHYACNCPQSNRGACKHLDIVDAFDLYPERIDKGWFYCHQTSDWFPPVRDAEGPTQVGDPEQGAQLSRREPIDTPEATDPPAEGGGEAGPPQVPASLGTSEVEGLASPSDVPKFNRRGL